MDWNELVMKSLIGGLRDLFVTLLFLLVVGCLLKVIL